MVSCPGSTPANQGVSADGIWQDHGILLTHHPHQNSRENWLWGEEGDTSASWFFPEEVAPALPAGCLVLPPGPSCSSTEPRVAPLLNRDIILNTCFLGLQVLVPNPRTCPQLRTPDLAREPVLASHGNRRLEWGGTRKRSVFSRSSTAFRNTFPVNLSMENTSRGSSSTPGPWML